VLVNRLSASASEIFAGAIQDYQRGVILGSQTFGKGTVQELIPLGDGQIKITRSKFYRISGASTQHKGVTPNILFPDIYEVSDDIGESALPTALPWDTIEPNFYRPYSDLRLVVPTLTSKHDARLKTDPDFVFIRAEIEKAKEDQANNELTLNEAKLLAEREERDQWRLQLENARRVAKGQEPLADVKALEEKDKADGNADEAEPAAAPAPADKDKPKEPDPYLVESGRILLDMIALQGNGSRVATVPPAAAGQPAAPL